MTWWKPNEAAWLDIQWQQDPPLTNAWGGFEYEERRNKSMRIYLAARYSRREELCEYRKQLEDLGHTVTSRWLDGKHEIDDQGLSVEAKLEERMVFAKEDFQDVISAELCISFTEPPRSTNSRGGRHVEHGIALGRMLRVWIVGPRENVFHCLENVRQFDNWEQLLAEL